MTTSMSGRWKTAIGYGTLARLAARIATAKPAPASNIIPPKARRTCARRLARGRRGIREGSSSLPHSVGPFTEVLDQPRNEGRRGRRACRPNCSSSIAKVRCSSTLAIRTIETLSSMAGSTPLPCLRPRLDQRRRSSARSSRTCARSSADPHPASEAGVILRTTAPPRQDRSRVGPDTVGATCLLRLLAVLKSGV
jgi:hypothetical protein